MKSILPFLLLTMLAPLAATSKGYFAELPDGDVIQTPFTSVKVLPQPVKSTPCLACRVRQPSNCFAKNGQKSFKP